MDVHRLVERRRVARALARGRLFTREPNDPLRVMFVLTFMPVGGAETLLVNLVRRMDRRRFAPEICCLKYPGPLGEAISAELPVHAHLLRHKYDLAVVGRLARLFDARRIDAVITIGTGGDKMFWGRLAAWQAGVPVVASALHSTGLPDRVERLNRWLAPGTDAFIAVAEPHARYIAAHEGCPAGRVRVIPNGVDLERFSPRSPAGRLAAELNLAAADPVVAIVAALRPEKRHEVFLRVAARVRAACPAARFLVIGDGPRRGELEAYAGELGLGSAVRFLGSRADVPELLSLVDVLLLTSRMEANPVSLLEALATETPVVAPRVGSIPRVVADGEHGWLVEPDDEAGFVARTLELLADPAARRRMGAAGRAHVAALWSLEQMVAGYQDLIAELYAAKCRAAGRVAFAETLATAEPETVGTG